MGNRVIGEKIRLGKAKLRAQDKVWEEGRLAVCSGCADCAGTVRGDRVQKRSGVKSKKQPGLLKKSGLFLQGD